MEKDDLLKNILLQAAEPASPLFEETVLKKIKMLSAKQLSYQPLVHPKLERGFLIVFAAVVFLFLLVCLLISLFQSGFIMWLQTLQLSYKVYQTTLTFLATFWFVFAIKMVLEKPNRFSRRRLFL
ncbi:MAG TPA: hypothetical protein VM010_04345 [Chitinophagaceae bacterium]|nr:hypothetical protein [Chitinophagaceae bacterium]